MAGLGVSYPATVNATSWLWVRPCLILQRGSEAEHSKAPARIHDQTRPAAARAATQTQNLMRRDVVPAVPPAACATLLGALGVGAESGIASLKLR